MTTSNPRGRPKLAPGMARTTTPQIRLTEDEMAAIVDAAYAASGYCRAASEWTRGKLLADLRVTSDWRKESR